MQRFRAVSLRSFAVLVLFLPMTRAARAQQAAPPSMPQVRLFSDGGDDRSGHITTDAAGNLYIAAGLGNVHDNNAFAVLKYSPQGKVLGAFHFNPSALSSGFANDVKVDADGNIYAGGFTFPFGGLVISFDPSGNTRWMQFLGISVARLALDQSGNVLAAGDGANFMAVAKYSANGDVLWTRMHRGTGQGSCTQGAIPGCVTDLRVDSNGNAVVFGLTTNANPTSDTTVLKIDPQGKVLWFRNFTQPGGFNIIPFEGAVDSSDSIYATGQEVNLLSGERINFTVKYDKSGNLIFALTGTGSTGSGIGGRSVAVDPTGDIRLTGETLVQGEEVCAASKIDPIGKTIWVTPVTCFSGLVNDTQGNSFVYSATGDYSISKLNSAGQILWTSNTPPNLLAAQLSDALVDSLGNLRVAGFGLPPNAGLDDIVTLKFPKNFKPNSTR